jgi:hypothetical protein
VLALRFCLPPVPQPVLRNCNAKQSSHPKKSQTARKPADLTDSGRGGTFGAGLALCLGPQAPGGVSDATRRQGIALLFLTRPALLAASSTNETWPGSEVLQLFCFFWDGGLDVLDWHRPGRMFEVVQMMISLCLQVDDDVMVVCESCCGGRMGRDL